MASLVLSSAFDMTQQPMPGIDGNGWQPAVATATQFTTRGPYTATFFGSGFTYGGVNYDDVPSTGVATRLTQTTSGGAAIFDLTGISLEMSQYYRSVINDVNGDGVADFGSSVLGFYINGEPQFAYLLSGADTVTGSTGNDVLKGYQGDDVIRGGAGNDVLDGGPGRDTLSGDEGSDTVSYAVAGKVLVNGVALGVNVSLLNGGYFGEATGDTYAGIENLTGSPYNDVLEGIAGVANTLIGGAGDDVIYGEGIDSVNGGAGNDVFFGGQGGALNLNVGQAQLETVWTSFASDVVDGSTATSNLTLIGQGPTSDTMRGGSGADFIYFRDGDVISGGAGSDWAVATLSGTGVNLNLATTGFEAAWGSTSNDTLTAAGSFTQAIMVGDAGNDTLTGGNATDFLYGFGGNDRLIGGGGNDVLVGDGHIPGGAGGADTFVFGAASQTTLGTDQIFYFTSGADRLEFNAAAFGFSAGASLTNGANFVANANPTAAQAGPSFLYNTSNGLLSFDLDGNGSGQGYFVAQFFQAVPVAAADFAFV